MSTKVNAGSTSNVAAPSPRKLNSDGTYTVRPGDTLTAIAMDLLGSSQRWKELADRNGIDDPKRLQLNARLVLPGSGPAPAPKASPSTPWLPPPSPALAAPRPAPAPIAPPKLDVFTTTSPRSVPTDPLPAAMLPRSSPVGGFAQPGTVPVDPLDVLKLVKNGDVQISLPLAPGDILGGKLHIKPGTVVTVHLHAHDGMLDLNAPRNPNDARVDIHPPMGGPLWTSVRGLYVGSDGRIAVDISGFPDAHIGSPLPAKLSDLVDQVHREEGTKLPISIGPVIGGHLFGIPVGSFPMPSPGGATSVPSLTAKAPGEPVLSGARVSIHDVEFADGQMPLGHAGQLALAPGSKVSIDGTLDNLTVTGHVAVARLALDSGGTRLNGVQGTADVAASFRRTGSGPAVMSTSITNLNLATQYAVTERTNGDYIALAQGHIVNGSLKFQEGVSADFKLQKPQLVSLDIGKFDGVLQGAKLSVIVGGNPSQIAMGSSLLSGDVHVTPDHILVEGMVDVNASIRNLDPGAGKFGAAIDEVDIHGRAHATFDSTTGFKLRDGALNFSANMGRATVTSDRERLQTELAPGSRIQLQASELDVTPGKDFTVQGRGQVDLNLKNTSIGRNNLTLAGDQAHVHGKADLTIDSKKGVTISNANLALDAAIRDGHIQMGDKIDLHLKAGTQLHAALSQAFFGKGGSTIQMQPGARVQAVLASGKVQLPTGAPLILKSGGTVDFAFDQLSFDKAGLPTASGTMTLDVLFDESQLDLKSFGPGASLVMQNGKQHLKLTLGQFTLKPPAPGAPVGPDGQPQAQFDATGVVMDLQAQIDHFGGSFPIKKPGKPSP